MLPKYLKIIESAGPKICRPKRIHSLDLIKNLTSLSNVRSDIGFTQVQVEVVMRIATQAIVKLPL